jgi:glycosyltransferase involved in cell wall biosynthesis
MKVAFVVQRYGADIGGGSELLCKQLAERMAQHWSIDVLTSCALDYTTWDNHHEPGLQLESGVNVHRFRTDFPRNTRLFNRLSSAVYRDNCTDELAAKWAREQGPYSSEFLRHLLAHHHEYDLIFFFTYLYGFTFFGMPLVPAHKTVLVPTAHDEAPFHIPIYKTIFNRPTAWVFCTPEERALVESKFLSRPLSCVAGVGVDPCTRKAMPLNRSELKLGPGPLISYVGRIDQSKGCQDLCEKFASYVRSTGDQALQLVLAGKKNMDIPQHPQIRYIGYVAETLKQDLISESSMFVMPSPYESLSIALLEAWNFETPSLCNFGCEVLKGQTVRSGAGQGYTNQAEFNRAVKKLLGEKASGNRLGQRGRAFVSEFYSWPVIESRFLSLGEKLLSGLISPNPSERLAPLEKGS